MFDLVRQTHRFGGTVRQSVHYLNFSEYVHFWNQGQQHLKGSSSIVKHLNELENLDMEEYWKRLYDNSDQKANLEKKTNSDQKADSD